MNITAFGLAVEVRIGMYALIRMQILMHTLVSLLHQRSKLKTI